ncbi:hypothetical protein [Pseudomonas petroselini]|uniref:hypothetical protein n=1 Tax=Pseudomonas petroselini TaxID=2899822 RepID=UPI00386DB32C
MIPEIETLMRHWGEQNRRCNAERSLGSPLGTLMRFGGLMPRGTPGSRELSVGAGPDHIAREVEAALAWLQHQGEQGQRLAKLASLRYLPERELSVVEQMRLLGLEATADRTYRNWVQRLHDLVLARLNHRALSRSGGC